MQFNALLFAQFKFPGQGQQQPDIPIGLLIGFGVAFLILVLIGIVIQVFYCLTLSKALNQVSKSNRLMEPGMVWLLFIPCFNLFWNFMVVTKIPDSLKAEFKDRGGGDRSDYGRNLGMTSAVLMAVGQVMSCIPFVNYCAGFVMLVWLVFGIMFWVKIAGYSSQLATGGSGSSRKRKADLDDDFDEES